MGEKARGDSALEVAEIDPMRWCRVVRASGLSRPWDLLFPPASLYRRNSRFETGEHHVFGLVRHGRAILLAYVLAMRGNDSCLIDVRAPNDGSSSVINVMIDHWHQVAERHGATSMIGPVGAFAFLTDGVAEAGDGEVKSIHIPVYPATLVDCFIRRGYVHAWSGAVWGQHERPVSNDHEQYPLQTGVQRGTWMSAASSVSKLERVLSASFTTLPWHRGRGAAVSALAMSYAPVYSPSLALAGEHDAQTVGAVLMYRDVASVPTVIYSLPRILQKIWLWAASRRSNLLHVSVIGLLPEARNTRVAVALFRATRQAFSLAEAVTTSWVRVENRASQMMCERAGLRPLQYRTVFHKVLSTISNH
jgi:hypothetical protein